MQLPPHMPSAEQFYNKMIHEQMPDIQSNFLLESNGGDGTKVLKVLEVIPLILISTTERGSADLSGERETKGPKLL
ncbi:hypothetical protein NHJ13051_009523 [Beauveria bassiana]